MNLELAKIHEDLERHYGKTGLLNIFRKIVKVRAMGIDIDGELDKEIARLKGQTLDQA